VFNHVIDYGFHEVLAEKFEEYIDTLRWCGSCADFRVGGQARAGWKKYILPLIEGT